MAKTSPGNLTIPSAATIAATVAMDIQAGKVLADSL